VRLVVDVKGNSQHSENAYCSMRADSLLEVQGNSIRQIAAVGFSCKDS
jgi:hypothetical protein